MSKSYDTYVNLLIMLILKRQLSTTVVADKGCGTEITSCVGGPQYDPPPVTLTFDFFTLKVVSESRATWATSVPILVFLGLSVLDVDPMYATDSDIQTSDSIIRLMPPA